MFERTVSLWRRLLGSRPGQAAGAAAAEEERRVSLRYPTDHPVAYEPAGATDGVRYQARVRNVSQGGVNLLVDREFREGDLLSVALPDGGPETPATVLACVVHVRPVGDGRWSVGCTFARELSDVDLARFGVPDARPEQRTRPRYSCDVEARYQSVTTPAQAARPAKVLNISTTGIGLQVGQPIPVGTLLSIDLAHAGGDAPKTMLSCVVHVSAQPDRQWALGCNFIHQMSEHDLNALL